ncbi:MAG TPA: hypothetical protein VMU01_05400 [Rhizomicrobium sp.]|nr:hypothetical protein [Rhizomicrobium sp.]
MKRLPDLPLELKALATAILIFAGLAVLMGYAYIVGAHQGTEGGYGFHVEDIAALYTGPGVSTVTLISLAHIHLLGLLSVFSIIGFIFVHSTLATGWRIGLSVLPFLAFLIDVSSWFLTKFVSINFVYLVIAGGATFISTLGLMILISLYDLWLGRRTMTA